MMYDKLDSDELVILSSCLHLVEAIPQLIADPDDLEDVLKTDTKADDCYDGFTMGLYNWERSMGKPHDVKLREAVAAAPNATVASMVHMKMMSQRKGKERFSGR